MCGIAALLGLDPDDATAALPATILKALQSRGPDHSGSVRITYPTPNGDTDYKIQGSIVLNASVLHLRGSELIKQPLRDSNSGSVLCFNGEIYALGTQNEVPVILRELRSRCATIEHVQQDSSSLGCESLVLQYLLTLKGPWSLVYYDAPHGRVWFGRDPSGRRSLLRRPLRQDRSRGGIMLSSVAGSTQREHEWVEVDTRGMYVFHLATKKVTLQPWPVSWSPNVGTRFGPRPPPTYLDDQRLRQYTTALHNILLEAVRVRVCDAGGRSHSCGKNSRNVCAEIADSTTVSSSLSPSSAGTVESVTKNAQRITSSSLPYASDSSRVGILFSGGVDCTVLAALAHHCLLPRPNTRPGTVDVDVFGCVKDNSSTRGTTTLERGGQNVRMVSSRISHDPSTDTMIENRSNVVHSSPSSRTLPALQPEEMEPIDLINVCFDAPNHCSPDRLGAVQALRALKRCCPGRPWRLIFVDIDPDQELARLRRDTDFQRLLWPKESVMDFNIGAGTVCFDFYQ